MNRALIAILVVLLLILGGLLWCYLPDLLHGDRSGWSSNEYGTCYFNTQGDPVSGWHTIADKTYYFTPETCTLHHGWLQDGSRRFYIQEGLPVTGWQTVEDQLYFFGADGVLHTGWMKEDGKQYYFSAEGIPAAGWTKIDGETFYFDDSGKLCTGIVETDKGIYCFHSDGSRYSGWITQDGKQYYFREDGSAYTGWLREGNTRYYLTDRGQAATGKIEIEGQFYYFSSTGKEIILVNRWNPLPEEYKPAYVYVEGHAVDPECKEHLMQMLADCRAAGHHVEILSAYRSYRDQGFNYNNAVWARVWKGMAMEQAMEDAAMNVALAGTSEHQLGLAVDLIDSQCKTLEEIQESLPGQQWFMENCWNYGFILRYPNGTTEHTGIVYEPWHYRYVGVELALELRDLDICLEEYLDMLTEDGSRCNDQPPAEYALYAPYNK